jgi:2-polyprenyl-3-methyl-5-hydroxy-6-metoxy-1,4-benzoquinol methylase
MKQATFRALLDEVDDCPANTILDVGCATGDLLCLLDRPGRRLFGVDLNREAVKRAEERLPSASLHAGTLRDGPFPDIRFDVVTMVDFLEHVRDPEEELVKAAARLSDPGRLIISTPCAGSFVHRVTRRSWPQYREEHVTYLSRLGMKSLLARAGLACVALRSTRKAVTFAYLYGQATAYPHPMITPAMRFAYQRLPLRGARPIRLWFGEMTVVAAREPATAAVTA